MLESTPSLLGPWSSFYVMTGPSAAALVGLMFVVITLTSSRDLSTVSDIETRRAGIANFSTPTVVHLAAALFVSAILVAPWKAFFLPALSVGLVGLYGFAYCLRIVYRARMLRRYQADTEDWTWYWILPLLAYVAMVAATIALHWIPRIALFGIGGGVLLLLLVGIHNAWDIVTYVTVDLEESAGGGHENTDAR
ncbi:MAG: hypothetical protein JO146_02880 [Candidatus Eremiobacteraeota bacterium]|nr:hypothetical protein [Candidatus Eremiobacteraeota bacterium]